MFRYLTVYRWYALAKAGFSAAYLWYVVDFFRIHCAIWHQLSSLLADPADISFSGLPQWDVFLRRAAVLVSCPAMVWVFLLLSPVAAGLFLWGRRKWVQLAVGCWMCFSMLSLTSLIGVFNTTADIWLNYVFVFYSLAALVCPAAEWDKNEPGFSLAAWRENPAFTSTFAWLAVLLQFCVYFFAGVSKLVIGWAPWTSGVALQNLAFDSSMHEFVRGTHVPYWLSLILCYVTLLQRLVVPFGFFLRRGRFWSLLILGSMHIGYAILMYVNLFPLVGLASLLLVWPPRNPPVLRSTSRRAAAEKMVLRPSRPASARNIVVGLCSLWLLVASVRLIVFRPWPWENKLMIVPEWRMFADGGVTAGGKWRVLLRTPQGTIDATEIPMQMLPHVWRDRFYLDTIFHDLLNRNIGPGSLVDRLLQATEKMYRARQLQSNGDPVILDAGFEIYRRDAGSH